MPEHLCSLKMGCVYLWLHFRCVGREKWVISNCSLTLFIPWPQENNLFITSACSEDVMRWLSSSLYIYIFFPRQRNEDRKTALLNLLSVKGLLGIFSMWRKIRKSPELLPSGWSHRLFPHSPWVSSILIKDSRVAAAGFPLQQTKQMKHENRKLASGSTGHLSSISYSVSDHQRGSGLWEEDVEASSSWLDLCHENGGLFLCTLCRSCLVGTQKLRGIRGGKFSKHLTFLSSVLKASSHSFSLLGPCMANKTRPPGSIHWRLLGGCTKHFEELNVNESGTRGFNFPRNSHVLGNEGGQCLAKCALIYLTQKYSPPHACPPLKIIQNFG